MGEVAMGDFYGFFRDNGSCQDERFAVDVQHDFADQSVTTGTQVKVSAFAWVRLTPIVKEKGDGYTVAVIVA